MAEPDSDSDLEITGEGTQTGHQLSDALRAAAAALADLQLPTHPHFVRAAPGAPSLVSHLHITAADQAVVEAALEQARDHPETTIARHESLTLDGRGFATLQDSVWLQVLS